VDAVEIGVEENFVQGVETGEAEHQDESRQDGKAVDDEGESLGGSGSWRHGLGPRMEISGCDRRLSLLWCLAFST